MRLFDPTDESQTRFRGYGPSRIPQALDDEVTAFLDDVIVGGPVAVARVLSTITEHGRGVFGAYAERMASLAVRRPQRELLLKAAVALVLAGLDENRLESLMSMVTIEDAAARIGVDLSELFEDTSKIVGHPGTVNLVLWLTRKEEDRTLACMGFIAASDEDGFRYKLDW